MKKDKDRFAPYPPMGWNSWDCYMSAVTEAELLENADVSSAEDSEITLGGQLYWIQRERLPKAGWHLITVVPMSSIGAKSDWIIRRALPVMLAMVCMTAVLCLGFLYIQYKPLNRLRKELAGTAGHALSGNEYDQLLAAFTDAKSSRDQIQMLWENQRNELRQEFVQSCIEGDVVYDEKHLHQVLERLDAGFSGDWFGVVLLDAGGGAETLLDSGREREALEDLLNHMAQGVRAYLLPRGRQWSILLNAATGSGIEQTVAELDALLKRAAREAGGDFLCAFQNHGGILKTSILLIWRPTKRCANSMKKPPVVRNNAGRLCSRRRCRGFPVSRRSF